MSVISRTPSYNGSPPSRMIHNSTGKSRAQAINTYINFSKALEEIQIKPEIPPNRTHSRQSSKRYFCYKLDLEKVQKSKLLIEQHNVTNYQKMKIEWKNIKTKLEGKITHQKRRNISEGVFVLNGHSLYIN